MREKAIEEDVEVPEEDALEGGITSRLGAMVAR